MYYRYFSGSVLHSDFINRYTPKQAKVKIAKFCAYQERCHQEVRDKLYSFGLPQSDVEEIICDLIQHDFLNEERFSLAFVRGKFAYKKWGKNKIKQELKRRKISEYCIKKGMKEINEDKYIEVLRGLLSKKIDSLPGMQGYQKNYKAVQFVLGKGYESDVAWEIIKKEFSV